MAKRRVVITGMGIVSPVGSTVATAWEAVIQGKSGVTMVDLSENEIDALLPEGVLADIATKIGARVKDFDPSLALTSKEERRLDMFVQYAAEAARQAVVDSGLEVTDALAPRCGVAIGSGIGGLPWIQKNYHALYHSGSRRISPFFIPGAIINMAAGYPSMKHNFKGPNISIVTACTTGLHNIGTAARMIDYGDADVMLAGGAEMATDALGIGGFNAARALSMNNDHPEQASRPFDKDRDGFVLGEGAGILVLEELEHAKARGAKIYAEVIGFGMSGDAYHMTSPEPNGEGAIACIQNALRDADIQPQDVQYINAHGTSTKLNDSMETAAIKHVFGEHAKQVAVSSTKSMTGHLLGAAGAVESIFSVLAIRDQIAPPTINLSQPDEGFDLNYVPNKAQPMKIDVVLSNSFGFGGTNGSIVFKKYE